jgi:tetratricopeptide (TPR) repeat protein
MFLPTVWVNAYKFRIAQLSIGCALLLIGFASVSAQSGGGTETVGTNGRHTIQGRIYYPSGRSADSRPKVRLENLNAGDLTVLADTNGEFTFKALSPGKYTVVVEAGNDFETFRETVYIDAEVRTRSMVLPSVARIFSVNAHLSPKANTSPTKAGVIDASMASVPSQAKALYERGLEAARKGENQRAVELFTAAVERYPQFPHALNELGVQYLRLGKPDRAVEALRSAVALVPNSFTPLLNYGIALLNKKAFQEAATQLRAALRQKESSPTAHMYLGIALIKVDNYEDAEKEMLRAIAVGGQNLALVHYYLGGIYWRKQDYKRAADALEKYLQIEPKAPDAARVAATIRELRSKPGRASG